MSTSHCFLLLIVLFLPVLLAAGQVHKHMEPMKDPVEARKIGQATIDQYNKINSKNFGYDHMISGRQMVLGPSLIYCEMNISAKSEATSRNPPSNYFAVVMVHYLPFGAIAEVDVLEFISKA